MTINGWNPEELPRQAFNYDIPFHQMVNVADNEWDRFHYLMFTAI